jgi:hypothetical protein
VCSSDLENVNLPPDIQKKPETFYDRTNINK